MKSDDTLQTNPNDSPDRHSIEAELCGLIDEACVRLDAPSTKSHRDLLLGFHDAVRNGDTTGLDALVRLLQDHGCEVYQTAEDDLFWSQDTLPVQLEQARDDGFIVSVWARRIIQLATAHRR